MSFIKSLPGLLSVSIYGKILHSLEGIEDFPGEIIIIDTGNNTKRNIDDISKTAIETLDIKWANTNDVIAIGRCKRLKRVRIANIPELYFDMWSNTLLENIQIIGGKITEIKDTIRLTKLKILHCAACRKLERFNGDNSGVTGMIIDSCNKLDIITIFSFNNIEFIAIVDMKNEIPLSVFSQLPDLRELRIQGRSNVKYDTLQLNQQASKLQQIYIQSMKTNVAIEMSICNLNTSISNDHGTFLNGNIVKN